MSDKKKRNYCIYVVYGVFFFNLMSCKSLLLNNNFLSIYKGKKLHSIDERMIIYLTSYFSPITLRHSVGFFP